jgi:LysM repeat protein
VPTEAAEPTQAPVPTQPPAAGEERTHVVQPGENLYRISLSYGLDYRDVMAYNGITNPNTIYVGQEIKIPPSTGAPSPQPTTPSSGGSGKTHVVQPGENLFRIALQYNMMYTTLAEANNLSYPYTIYTGQVLIIP